MSLLDTILNAQGGGAVQQLGSQLGLGEGETSSALAALVPAIAAGVQRNAQSGSGLTDLISALTRGQHQQYVNDLSSLAQPSTVQDGNKILGHVFGTKDVSRQVAAQAAAQTGVSADVLKKMLPMVAALVMGAMSQQAKRSQTTQAGTGPDGLDAGDLIGMLTKTLGGQGSGATGGLGGLLGKMFG